MNLLMVQDVSGTTTSESLTEIARRTMGPDAQIVTSLIQWMAYIGSIILFYCASRVISFKKKTFCAWVY